MNINSLIYEYFETKQFKYAYVEKEIAIKAINLQGRIHNLNLDDL